MEAKCCYYLAQLPYGNKCKLLNAAVANVTKWIYPITQCKPNLYYSKWLPQVWGKYMWLWEIEAIFEWFSLSKVCDFDFITFDFYKFSLVLFLNNFERYNIQISTNNFGSMNDIYRWSIAKICICCHMATLPSNGKKASIILKYIYIL